MDGLGIRLCVCHRCLMLDPEELLKPVLLACQDGKLTSIERRRK